MTVHLDSVYMNFLLTCSRDVFAAPANEDMRQSVRVGKLNLVDLAGSERVHITGATGDDNTPSLQGSSINNTGLISCTAMAANVRV